MVSKKKILFCHTGLSTFVQTDLDLLLEEYEVITYHYKLGTTKMMKLMNIISSFFFALNWVRQVDVVYVWFGGYHGFFPVLFSKLLGKKSIIIVGGYDASYVPSIKYGVFYQKGFQLWVIKRIYKWATYICPVDESLVKSINYYSDPTGIGYSSGILNHMALAEAKIKIVPTGYHDQKFSKISKAFEFDVMSVGYVIDNENFLRKGFDLVLMVAKILPNLKFGIIGLDFRVLNNIEIPPNVRVIEFVSQDYLPGYYSSSRIFLQLSLAEGLPNTLCEAMLCECIPIGANVNGIPKAIGSTGYILNEKNVGNLKSLIELAMKDINEKGSECRKYIQINFPISKRKNSIDELITEKFI